MSQVIDIDRLSAPPAPDQSANSGADLDAERAAPLDGEAPLASPTLIPPMKPHRPRRPLPWDGRA